MKLFAIAALATTALALADVEAQFINWTAKYGKQYGSLEEYAERLENWLATHATIQRLNAIEGATSFHGHNKFSDWSAAEKEGLVCSQEREGLQAPEATVLPTSDLPEEVNWLAAGAVGPVQDQGSCGGCWAFAAIAAMEGMHQITSGELVKLSEQECIDCDKDSFGCKGGWPDNCFWYVHDNNGINLDEKYPYMGYADRCFAPYNGPVTVSTVNHVPAYTEGDLLAAIAKTPVAVSIMAGNDPFLTYESGVITSEDCGTKLDHAVTAVGYGTDENGQDYYLIKNSWGSDWGDSGYVKIGRNGDGYGICGIQKINYWAQTN